MLQYWELKYVFIEMLLWEGRKFCRWWKIIWEKYFGWNIVVKQKKFVAMKLRKLDREKRNLVANFYCKEKCFDYEVNCYWGEQFGGQENL